MGAEQARLSGDRVADLLEQTEFSESEIQNLYQKFRKLDADHNGAISLDEFQSIPELNANPLLLRAMASFGLNKDNEVEFSSLIRSFNIFHSTVDPEAKLRFCFSIYDIDGDGFISNGELFRVLKMMVGANLTDIQLQQIVDKTILEADTTAQGKVSFEDFCRILKVDETTMAFDMGAEMKTQHQ